MVKVLKETTTLIERKIITLINLQKKLTFTWRSASSEPVVELQRIVSLHGRSVKRNHQERLEIITLINLKKRKICTIGFFLRSNGIN